jgi:catechol 2,3-dioxygenase-like lactoylglutathione lyase family enzyme
MPVREMPAAVAFYRDRLGFDVLHHDGGFAVLCRDDAVVHLCESSDESWRERSDVREQPICTGAESLLAGTASFRVQIKGVEELYEEMTRAGVLHPVSRESVDDTDFGTREFATLDQDDNLVTFLEWVSE